MNGNQRLCQTALDIFADLGSKICIYIHTGCHMRRVYITKPLTAAGKLKRPLLGEWKPHWSVLWKKWCASPAADFLSFSCMLYTKTRHSQTFFWPITGERYTRKNMVCLFRLAEHVSACMNACKHVYCLSSCVCFWIYLCTHVKLTNKEQPNIQRNKVQTSHKPKCFKVLTRNYKLKVTVTVCSLNKSSDVLLKG